MNYRLSFLLYFLLPFCIVANIKKDHGDKRYRCSNYGHDQQGGYNEQQPFPIKTYWGYCKIIFNKKESVLPSTQSKRADILLFSGGWEAWNWKKKDRAIAHNPGYTKELIAYLLSLDKKATHLILTTGYENVLRVLGCKHTEKNSMALAQKVASELDTPIQVIVLNTYDAWLMYSKLCRDSKNRVIIAAHQTC